MCVCLHVSCLHYCLPGSLSLHSSSLSACLLYMSAYFLPRSFSSSLPSCHPSLQPTHLPSDHFAACLPFCLFSTLLASFLSLPAWESACLPVYLFCQSPCLSFYLPDWLIACQLTVCLHACLSACVLVCLFAGLPISLSALSPVCLSVCLSDFLPIFLLACLPFCMYVCLTACMSTPPPPTCLWTYLFPPPAPKSIKRWTRDPGILERMAPRPRKHSFIPPTNQQQQIMEAGREISPSRRE